MKRLVIHPEDPTTGFLCKIYENLDDVTLVRGGKNKSELKQMMIGHDQIIMLGHGSAFGLMSVGQFTNPHWNIVDDSFAELLSKKSNSIFIWCNADKFVQYHKLPGFYTGMFVSELSEAFICGMVVSQREVDESNYAFAEIMGETIAQNHLYGWGLHSTVKEQYGRMIGTNRVAKYNHDRLHVA